MYAQNTIKVPLATKALLTNSAMLLSPNVFTLGYRRDIAIPCSHRPIRLYCKSLFVPEQAEWQSYPSTPQVEYDSGVSSELLPCGAAWTLRPLLLHLWDTTQHQVGPRPQQPSV